MVSILYARHQFPPAIIRHAVWLYLRFTLSFRDVEELLAERGIEVSYEGLVTFRALPGVPEHHNRIEWLRSRIQATAFRAT